MVRNLNRRMFVFSLAVLGTILPGSNASAEGLPSLPGTYWQLLSLTGNGKPIKDAENPADVEFLKDGTWGILHYGGRREAGKYTVNGKRLIMLNDDGETYNNAEMRWKETEGILELDSGEDLMRLRLVKPKSGG